MKWLLLVVLVPGLAWSQDVFLLDCGHVAFFGPACVIAPPDPPPGPPAQKEGPLFTPETMAKDTPRLMLKLLEEPTMENARAYLAWQQRRMQRALEVQALLRHLTQGERPDADAAP